MKLPLPCLSLCLLAFGSFACAEDDRIAPGAPIVSAGDIWVGPNGSDANPGTKESPLQSLVEAISAVKPGQTIWMLPGEYSFSETVQIPKKKVGTAAQPYRISGLTNGPRPKLNFTGLSRSSELRGLQVDSQYWHLHYLEIFGASDNNVNIAGSYNLFERLDIHDAGDTGLQINSSTSLLPSGNLVLNCDSYLNADNSAEDADGFAAKLIIGPGNAFEGCRAWHNCDDNWDLYDAQNVVTLKGCWAIEARHPTRSKRNSDGNGFKLGGVRKEDSSWNRRNRFTSYSDYVKANTSPHTLDACLAVGNPSWGFHRNNNPSTQIQCNNCGGWGNGKGEFGEGLVVLGEKVSLPAITPDMLIAIQRDANGRLPDLRTQRTLP